MCKHCDENSYECEIFYDERNDNYYFLHQRIEINFCPYCGRELGYTENYGKWIPCNEELPYSDDFRNYLVLVESHIGYVPVICQYESDYGFGYYKNNYSLFPYVSVDIEFETLEELGYRKAMYWMQIPEPPIEEEGE